MPDPAVDRYPDGQRPLVAFVHIPKTAGTTLRMILSMNEPGRRTMALGNVFKGGGGLSKALIARLRNGSVGNLDRISVVRGHFPLGVCDHLPTEREVRCFAFLREPVDRTLSHFYAIRQGQEAEARKRLPPLSPEATVDDAFGAGYLYDNLHTRMLSGLLEPFDEVTDEMLDRAKRNLREGLVVFGLTERFDESLVLLKHRLGFGRILYRASGRVNPKRPRPEETPKKFLRTAERLNRYDLELYRYAQELFDAVPERGDLEFELDLAALRVAKANDAEVEVPAPPESFTYGEEIWGMLVDARSKVLDLEWQLSSRHIPPTPTTVGEEILKRELQAARASKRELEEKVETLEATIKASSSSRRSDAKATSAEPHRGETDTKPGSPGRKRGAAKDGHKRARRGKRAAKPGGSKRDAEPHAQLAAQAGSRRNPRKRGSGAKRGDSKREAGGGAASSRSG